MFKGEENPNSHIHYEVMLEIKIAGADALGGLWAPVHCEQPGITLNVASGVGVVFTDDLRTAGNVSPTVFHFPDYR